MREGNVQTKKGYFGWFSMGNATLFQFMDQLKEKSENFIKSK